ncbi:MULTISPECIES: GTP 3',8-cyclase MoaA [unclassified Thioalkalivibrio]|uniref:GTP 3',8-cyclase MoaA n=1 Tax=unclassified Thioalkalivibrio TaxID=2621013 RepID=UPI00037F0F4F|nr:MULTISPECIES: GTP 3',8-cyclase MoaA [unclassified Thioalkalivibrio]
MNDRGLVDPFGRKIEYVRVSVTDRCDLRCFYCMPEGFRDFEVPEHWLTFDEIERVMAAFGRLGTRRVRLTGGEPLVRHELPDLAARLNALPGIDDISLSTNAVRLAKHADALAAGGVGRINVSLDTLRPEVFKDVTGGKLEKVLDGLMAAKRAGLDPIKINMVVMGGINDTEVGDMVDFCIEHGFTLRFIETMPVGDTGRAANEGHYVNLQDVRRDLEQRFELIPGVMPGGGPARYVQVAGTDIRIGFITPISQHFCDTCNRVRLSVDGTIHTCLGNEHSLALRPRLRDGCSDAELEEAILEAIALKPERHEFNERPEKVMRFMSMTGG